MNCSLRYGTDRINRPSCALRSDIPVNCRGNWSMPRQEVIRKARQDKRAGKSATTQAGQFVKDQINKIRKGKHVACSTKQAVAIGLSEARRAGFDLPPPRKG